MSVALHPSVLEAALEVVAREGYIGTTVELVAEEAAVPTSEILAAAEDLDDLLAEAILQGYETWRAQSGEDWQPLVEGDSMVAALRAALHRQARALADPPPLVVVGMGVVMLDLPDDLPAVRACRGHREQAESELTAWLRHAVDRDPTMPDCRPERAQQCAQILMSAFEGYLVARLAGEEIEPDGFAEVLLGLLLHALIG